MHFACPFSTIMLQFPLFSVFAWQMYMSFMSWAFASVVFFIGIHTNWSYVLWAVSTSVGFVQSIVVPSGIRYITSPSSIVLSPSAPDMVNPPGITAMSPFVSSYSVVSDTLSPGSIVEPVGGGSIGLSISSNSPISSSILFCRLPTLLSVLSTASFAVSNSFPFIATFIVTVASINIITIVIIRAIRVIPFCFLLILFLFILSSIFLSFLSFVSLFLLYFL